jgi:hypothetical protein
MFIDTDINSKSILAYPFNETKLAIPKGRLADFSDIYIESGTIYTLARFASTIAIIEKTKSGYQEKQFWSFSHIENDPRWAYMDMQFGHAEGLTMDTHKIYIVLDNNGDSRRKDRDDSRPLLFILKRP